MHTNATLDKGVHVAHATRLCKAKTSVSNSVNNSVKNSVNNSVNNKCDVFKNGACNAHSLSAASACAWFMQNVSAAAKPM